MPGENIIDMDVLIKQFIGPNKEIIDVKTSRLTAPGENYCSVMLKLDITLKNVETGMKEEVNAVAKTINTEVSDFFKLAAPPQFRKEIAFYTKIVPTLQKFQRDLGMTDVLDIFPKLYVARKNMNGNNEEIDDDAVIIMENLKEQGYILVDRVIGFDLEGAKCVLKNLAKFHAVPIALKLQRPAVFEENVKKHCSIKSFPAAPPQQKDQSQQPPEWLQYVAQQEKCKPYFEALCKVMAEMDVGLFFERPYEEPFAGLAHYDMWVNNTMHLVKDGKLIKSKFVDFQLYQYGSTISDVIHFIFASCQNEVSRDHFDELLEYYHTNFVEILEGLGCDTTPFAYSKFLERVEIEAPAEMFHTLIMAVPIQGKRGVANVSVENESFKVEGATTIEAKEKIAHEVYEFGKRGWIK